MGLWDAEAQRQQLLTELVAIPSVTGSQAEFDFPYAVVERLNRLQYFQEFPDHLRLHPVGDGRHVLTALVKCNPEIQDTVVLLSHFDVVDVQDYGTLKDFAYRVEDLTDYLYANASSLPDDVREDVESGHWIFGRGTMDMKCGLVLHMAILEQACNQAFAGNILLVTVPDEEVNSIGMRTAVSNLLELADEHHLTYKLLLNSEPNFGKYQGDRNKYVYTGSIGKVLPGCLCYGRETHVGEPWSGLNANYMASVLTNEIELNWDLCEQVEGELTPPPTNLIQKGLKDDYSTQIPYRAVALFNMFAYRRPMKELVDRLLHATRSAADKIEAEYAAKAKNFARFFNIETTDVSVRVLTYEELYDYAVQTYGEDEVNNTLEMAVHNYDVRDDRDTTVTLVNHLATLCRDLAPMMVLFFAPPYYPAVNSTHHPLVDQLTKKLIVSSKEQYGIDLRRAEYFGGISDLSFVGLEHPLETLRAFTANTPLWPDSYVLPLAQMSQLTVPVLNLGPVGRDAHKWTERLDVDFAFDTLYSLLEDCIRDVFTLIRADEDMAGS